MRVSYFLKWLFRWGLENFYVDFLCSRGFLIFLNDFYRLYRWLLSIDISLWASNISFYSFSIFAFNVLIWLSYFSIISSLLFPLLSLVCSILSPNYSIIETYSLFCFFNFAFSASKAWYFYDYYSLMLLRFLLLFLKEVIFIYLPKIAFAIFWIH